MAERSRTLTLYFDMGRKPSLEMLFSFLSGPLKIKKMDLECVQEEVGEPYIHLKFRKIEVRDRCAGASERYAIEVDGERSFVYISLDGEKPRKVRVRNVPPEMSSTEVCDAMSKYGRVLGEELERFKTGPFAGLRNGNRLITMCLFDYVPNFINILGHEAMVDYRGQPRTCRKCGGLGHLQAACAALADADDVPTDEEEEEEVEEEEEEEGPPVRRAASEPPPSTPAADVTSLAADAPPADASSPRGRTSHAEPNQQPAVSEQTTEARGEARHLEGADGELEFGRTLLDFVGVLKQPGNKKEKKNNRRKRGASGSPEEEGVKTRSKKNGRN